jgi:hypothetical protein
MVKEQELRAAISDEIMEQPFYIPTYYNDSITMDIFKAVLQERQRNAHVARDHKHD